MCEIVYNILITNFTVHRCIIRSNAPSNLQMQPLGCIFVYALNCITFGTAIDPAMGSAGFICAAAAYISENYRSDLMKTENKKHYTTTMFSGFDTDQTMLRIGAMNMMLHGVEAPNISWQDSLSEDNTDRKSVV